MSTVAIRNRFGPLTWFQIVTSLPELEHVDPVATEMKLYKEECFHRGDWVLAVIWFEDGKKKRLDFDANLTADYEAVEFSNFKYSEEDDARK